VPAVPTWSKCALKTTYVSRSSGSLPRRMPTTLGGMVLGLGPCGAPRCAVTPGGRRPRAAPAPRERVEVETGVAEQLARAVVPQEEDGQLAAPRAAAGAAAAALPRWRPRRRPAER
jgi:hypothetical protein